MLRIFWYQRPISISNTATADLNRAVVLKSCVRGGASPPNAIPTLVRTHKSYIDHRAAPFIAIIASTGASKIIFYSLENERGVDNVDMAQVPRKSKLMFT